MKFYQTAMVIFTNLDVWFYGINGKTWEIKNYNKTCEEQLE